MWTWNNARRPKCLVFINYYFQIGLYFELKMCKKCWLFMRMNAIILIFLKTIWRIFQISHSSFCGMFHNSKNPQHWFWNYQNVSNVKMDNFFIIIFYSKSSSMCVLSLHGHWKVWIRKINLIFEHNSIYQWRIGLCTYSSSYPFF